MNKSDNRVLGKKSLCRFWHDYFPTGEILLHAKNIQLKAQQVETNIIESLHNLRNKLGNALTKFMDTVNIRGLLRLFRKDLLPWSLRMNNLKKDRNDLIVLFVRSM